MASDHPSSGAARDRLLLSFVAVLLAGLSGWGAFRVVEDSRTGATATPHVTTTSSTSTTTAPVSTTLPPVPTVSLTTTTSTTTTTEAPPYLDPSQAEARFEEYLTAGSGDDVDAFVEEWAFPIHRYYGTAGATEQDVRRQWADYTSKWPTRIFTFDGGLSAVNVGSDQVRIIANYLFNNTGPQGGVKCGESRLTLLVRTSDLRIVEASESKQRDGC
jgi:hypothetical protein